MPRRVAGLSYQGGSLWSRRIKSNPNQLTTQDLVNKYLILAELAERRGDSHKADEYLTLALIMDE